MLEEIIKYLPLIIPLAIVQFGLMIAALVHAIKHPRYKVGNQVTWILVILLINLIGPVLYFTIGRGEAAEEDYDKRS
jgi:multisubunit Na+/H+ antiporter MnhG subunit